MAIIRRLRINPGVSRVDLAEELNLNKSTVGRLVEELIEEGWLTESVTSVTNSLGRRPTPLVLNEARRLLIGASFTSEYSEVIATSLGGRVKELTTGTVKGSPEAVLDVLASQIHDLYRRLTNASFEIPGIGVAVPGPVLPESGVLHHSDVMGWKEVPVRDMLVQRLRALGMPECMLVVERAVACVALQHFESKNVSDAEPLLYVQVGPGIAVVAVSRGQIVHGHQGLAGYSTHLVLERDGPLCDCGQRGCARVVVTSRAMELALGIDTSTIRTRATAGDIDTLNVMRQTGKKLGTFLFNLCLQYDPAHLFLGGPAFQLGSEFIQAAQRQLNVCAESADFKLPNLHVMRFDGHTNALGAATAVLHRLLQSSGDDQSNAFKVSTPV